MDTSDTNRLQEGRQAMAKKCTAIAWANVPKGWGVFYRKRLSGRCFYARKVIYVPKPVTRRSLHLFLHECAHAHLHKRNGKKVYIQEYEAEQWAFKVMRENGIPVPKKALNMAKRYVAWKISQALRRGLRDIDSTIKKWCGCKQAQPNEVPC